MMHSFHHTGSGFPSGGLGDNLLCYMAYGAIMTATDSVAVLSILDQETQPSTYSLVFGEGVLNDAISIVLFKTFTHIPATMGSLELCTTIFFQFAWYIVISTAVGVGSGLLCCLVIRRAGIGEEHPHLEVLMTLLFAWLSYMFGEVLNVSPIVSCFACGIILSHYNYYNMAADARLSFGIVAQAASEAMESITFFYVGITVMGDKSTKESHWDFLFILAAMFSFITARGASIGGLTLLANLTYLPPSRTLSCSKTVVIWYAGLVRGVVAFALALTLGNFEATLGMTEAQHSVALTSTTGIVFFTTYVFGTLSKPLLDYCQEQEAGSNPPSPKERPSGLEADEAALGGEGGSLYMEEMEAAGCIVACLQEADETLLTRCFGGKHHSRSAHAEEMERRTWLAAPGASPRSGEGVTGMEHVHMKEVASLNVPLRLDMDGGEIAEIEAYQEDKSAVGGGGGEAVQRGCNPLAPRRGPG